jgi:hypothetical protein
MSKLHMAAWLRKSLKMICGFDSLHPLQYPRAFREFFKFLCHFCAKAFVSKWNASGTSGLRSHIHHSNGFHEIFGNVCAHHLAANAFSR